MDTEYDNVLTDDMALVAYLKLKSHTPISVEWTDGVCRWEFRSNAVSDATDFLEDRALVNPRDFTQAYANAKRELFRANPRSRVAEDGMHDEDDEDRIPQDWLKPQY